MKKEQEQEIPQRAIRAEMIRRYGVEGQRDPGEHPPPSLADAET